MNILKKIEKKKLTVKLKDKNGVLFLPGSRLRVSVHCFCCCFFYLNSLITTSFRLVVPGTDNTKEKSTLLDTLFPTYRHTNRVSRLQKGEN